MTSQLPVLDPKFSIIAISPPDPKDPLPPKNWRFSFSYWREREFFGLDRTDSGWFVSLLEKLKQLSEEGVERFLCDSRKIDYWRYHNINWNQKNIPVQIDDLDWLPEWVRENKEEFPLVQFQVSTALGRVVGFWDREHVFHIVLLDPYHNMQPSKSHNYRVDPCNPLGCDYTRLIAGLDEILERICAPRQCGYVDQIKAIPTSRESLAEANVLMVKLSDEDLEYANHIIESGEAESWAEIFRAGIEARYGGRGEK